MKRILASVALAAIVLLSFAAVPALAQNKPPAQPPEPAAGATAETLTLWNGIGRKLITMAEDFPEDTRPRRQFKTT